ncbi:MAG: UPF0280 family protein [Syntrophaceae bacterium]|nr:UPF0280 family protein [Syntrophaceae bacterium]
MEFKERKYRNQILKHNLKSYNVIVGETDLFITSDTDESEYVLKSIYLYRSFIQTYISSHPEFLTSLEPVTKDDFAPVIIRDMIESSRIVNVGPMAAVAGAIAQYVGYDLLKINSNVIVENGGDIFIKTQNDIQVGIFAGNSLLSNKLKIGVKKEEMPLGICTSSGTVGHSVSFGYADAVCVKAKSVSLADAAATALGNKVKKTGDIEKTLNSGAQIMGIMGIIIVMGKHLGVWGDFEFV